MSPLCDIGCDMSPVSWWLGCDAGTRESVHSIQRSHSWLCCAGQQSSRTPTWARNSDVLHSLTLPQTLELRRGRPGTGGHTACCCLCRLESGVGVQILNCLTYQLAKVRRTFINIFACYVVIMACFFHLSLCLPFMAMVQGVY